MPGQQEMSAGPVYPGVFTTTISQETLCLRPALCRKLILVLFLPVLPSLCSASLSGMACCVWTCNAFSKLDSTLDTRIRLLIRASFYFLGIEGVGTTSFTTTRLQ